MMDGWGMYDGDGWIALILLFTLVAGAVAALVVATGHGHSPDSDADRILRRRFAAGEIDEDEYLRRRSLLHGGL